MSKVLFITEKVSFISEGIINHLKAQDFEVLTVKPDVTAISNFLKEDNGSDEGAIDPEVAALLTQESEAAEGEGAASGGEEKKDDIPRIFILYLQGEDNLMIDVLGYIRDLVEDRGIRFFVIGTQEELDTIIGKKADYVAQMYTRPVDLAELIKRLQKEGEAVDKLKEFKSILIVDDDATALRSMKSLLSTHYKILVASSGMNAITILAKNKVDLILLDFEMPIVNGPKVLEMIRSDPNTANIPVMFLTAKGDKRSIMEVLRFKPEKYLLKTMLPKDILDSIDEFFKTRR
ncbi:MAG: response regulator [Synergistaceae bacterium]|nr:response regulator [Synergistaceae bacterium]MBQ3346836.1 response regulator [Synergistaceae bacterium]MBQ3398496.1 response regulator [Synergistaceae bacterium]MBQ3758218.1 response regulator [Synergistaceae bacterium]MBQ4401448.1 response regulator [Synergistaceae bacterium]